jgi:hypothetical protein
VKHALFAQALRVAYDILIVLEQQFCRQLCQVGKATDKRFVKVRDVAFVEPFEAIVAQKIRELLKTRDLKERKNPLVEYKFLAKRHLRAIIAISWLSSFLQHYSFLN